MLPSTVTGTLTGTGAAITVPLGFKPKRLEIFNVTSGDSLVFTDTMAAGKGVKKVAAGTSSYIASGGITLYDGVPGPASLSGTLAVTAGSAAVTGTLTKFLSEVKVGDLLAIPGVGATGIGGTASTDQMYVKVIAIASDTALTAQVVSDYTASGKAAYNTAGISEGFTIGTDTDINVNGEVLHYVASRAV